MMNLSKAIAVITALAAGSVLISGTAIAEDYYPDKFKHRADVPVLSVGEGNGIPLQYRSR
jgi:hypothetical protein